MLATLISAFFENDAANEQWLVLNMRGRFPVAMRRYFHHAASLFHQAWQSLPEEFANRSTKFVCDSRSRHRHTQLRRIA